MTTSKPVDSIFLKCSLTVIRLSPPSISLKFRAGVDGLKHSLRSCRIASFEKSTPRHGIWTRKNGPMWSPSGPWNGVMLTKAQPSGFSRVRICSRNCRGEDTCSMTASATTTSYVQSPVTLPSPQTKLASRSCAATRAHRPAGCRCLFCTMATSATNRPTRVTPRTTVDARTAPSARLHPMKKSESAARKEAPSSVRAGLMEIAQGPPRQIAAVLTPASTGRRNAPRTASPYTAPLPCKEQRPTPGPTPTPGSTPPPTGRLADSLR